MLLRLIGVDDHLVYFFYRTIGRTITLCNIVFFISK